MTNVRPRRDKHPARSARILSTGIAVVSTLSVSTALTLNAQAADTALQPNGQMANGETTPQDVATQSVAPSAPGAATPAPTVDTLTITTPTVATLPTAPQVIDVPVPAEPQGGWNAPATSGSK